MAKTIELSAALAQLANISSPANVVSMDAKNGVGKTSINDLATVAGGLNGIYPKIEVPEGGVVRLAQKTNDCFILRVHSGGGSRLYAFCAGWNDSATIKDLGGNAVQNYIRFFRDSALDGYIYATLTMEGFVQSIASSGSLSVMEIVEIDTSSLVEIKKE